MNLYAVEYSYVTDAAALDEHRPAHREFLRALLPTPLVVAGAYQEADSPGALLLVRADSDAEVEQLLDEDPFWQRKLITQRRVRLWNPGIGTVQ
ncbi:hypothetical protein FOJ82_03155 [Tessaracoccus rhinocerotis]|uniref:YCII-related domain-containing protein n=1 Tax=Tessaracoccus rhinocerotis TaxID=1689449 RepID=A0A553K5G9_9ACTN|nr:YciI family protein [Tessaracoccus rhinocerotis]TRY19892.1 hypothetical protein FOJ82_03155 [Tessaracoccus rhinocerotis]